MKSGRAVRPASSRCARTRARHARACARSGRLAPPSSTSVLHKCARHGMVVQSEPPTPCGVSVFRQSDCNTISIFFIGFWDFFRRRVAAVTPSSWTTAGLCMSGHLPHNREDTDHPHRSADVKFDAPQRRTPALARGSARVACAGATSEIRWRAESNGPGSRRFVNMSPLCVSVGS